MKRRKRCSNRRDSDDDYEVDKEILVIDTPKSKLKSPIRKKRSPAKQIAKLSKQRSKVMSKSKEKATSSLNLPVDTELQNIELRMRNLEEITSVMDNTIASQVVNIMEHESEIEKLISCKIEEQLVKRLEGTTQKWYFYTVKEVNRNRGTIR